MRHHIQNLPPLAQTPCSTIEGPPQRGMAQLSHSSHFAQDYLCDIGFGHRHLLAVGTG
jgi:hypothetical protein